MSFLAHHCRTCTHAKHVHMGTEAGFERPTANTGAHKSCQCCSLLGSQTAGMRDFDPEPTLHETRAYPSGEIDPLVPPGGVWNEGSKAHALRVCNDDACQAKYAELVA